MISRQIWGVKYKLVASTDKRLGTVLMAIKRLDNTLILIPKRRRIRIITNNDLLRFEDAVKKEIRLFKLKQQILKIS